MPCQALDLSKVARLKATPCLYRVWKVALLLGIAAKASGPKRRRISGKATAVSLFFRLASSFCFHDPTAKQESKTLSSISMSVVSAPSHHISVSTSIASGFVPLANSASPFVKISSTLGSGGSPLTQV